MIQFVDAQYKITLFFKGVEESLIFCGFFKFRYHYDVYRQYPGTLPGGSSRGEGFRTSERCCDSQTDS